MTSLSLVMHLLRFLILFLLSAYHLILRILVPSIIFLAYRLLIQSLVLPYLKPSMPLTFFIASTCTIKPTKTPCCPATRLTPFTGSLLSDPTTYWSMVGALYTLPLLDQTWPSVCINCASLCNFLLQHIWRLPKGFFTMLRAPFRMAFIILKVHSLSLPSLMLIGQGILLIGSPLPVLWCFLVLILSLRPLRRNLQFHNPLQR